MKHAHGRSVYVDATQFRRSNPLMKPASVDTSRRAALLGGAALGLAALAAGPRAFATADPTPARRSASSPTREWKEPAAGRGLQRPPPRGHRTAGLEPAVERAPARDVRLPGLRAAAVQVGLEVQLRHRLAELLDSHPRRARQEGGLHDRRRAHRVSLRPLPRPPGPRLQRRPRVPPACATATTARR